MHYLQRTIFKLLVGILTAISTSSNSQSIKELVNSTDKSRLHLGAKLDDLVYVKNEWALQTDPFYPFVVYHRYKGNHLWVEKEFEVSNIGFLANDSNKVNQIYLTVPFSFDAFSYLNNKYGGHNRSFHIKNDNEPNEPDKTLIWFMKTFTVALYVDAINKKKLIIIQPTTEGE